MYVVETIPTRSLIANRESLIAKEICFRNNKTNKDPVINSTKGYFKEIFALHFEQRPRKNKNEKSGINSHQTNCFLHFGQNERPFEILSPLGKR